MSTRAFFLFLALAATFLWAYASRGQSVSPSGQSLPEAPLAPGERRPVLVELFTSEGCSSCPPADALLIRLENEQPVEGAEIIALGFHVDYWNYIGWRDRFSSAAYSDRQRDYAETFRGETVYTPQMIVDGHTEFVGNDSRRAAAAIQRAALAAKARVELSLAEARENRVKLEARVSGLQAESGEEDFDLWLAVTESSLSSRATRGENSGRQLSHTAVVREFRRVARLRPGREFTQQCEVKLSSDWKRENLRAVVFIQERATRLVVGAGQVRLPAS